MDSNFESKTHTEKFSEDIKLINEEMVDIDTTFNLVNQIFNKLAEANIKNLDYRSIPNMSRLIESLTALKSAKFNLIKERINVTKIDEDIKIKKDRNMEDDSDMNTLLDAIKALNSSNGEIDSNPVNEEENVDDLLESRLEELEKAQGVETPKTKEVDDNYIEDESNDELTLEIEEDDKFKLEPEADEDLVIESIFDIPSECEVVVTEASELFLVESDSFEIVEGYKLNLKVDFNFEKDGELVATIEGEEIEIVE